MHEASPNFYKELEQAAPATERELSAALDALKYNEAGLVPAIAQDKKSGEVLMLAWMNREAVQATLDTGRVTYFSRSRNELWRKGDTSGHIQTLHELRIDGDGDALLLTVEQEGAACHTNRRCCFYLTADANQQKLVVSSR